MPKKKGSSKFPSEIRFCVEVMWLSGATQKAIAGVTTQLSGRNVDQRAVKSIIASSKYSARNAMSLESRQKELNELKGQIPSLFHIPEILFNAKTLSARQKAETQSKQKPYPGRDGKAKILKRSRKQSATPFDWDIGSHPVEFFEASNRLADPFKGTDQQKMQSIESNKRRCKIARVLRDVWERSDVTPLRSVDLAAPQTGGFGPRSVSDVSIENMELLSSWKKEIPASIWAELESCFCKGEFKFREAEKKERDQLMNSYKLGLDIIAYMMHEMQWRDLIARWPSYDEWTQSEKLRPFIHNAKVITRPGQSGATKTETKV